MSGTESRTGECGYICKRCGDVAPYGVGYASTEPAAVQRSRTTARCACGYSVAPSVPSAPLADGTAVRYCKYTINAQHTAHGVIAGLCRTTRTGKHVYYVRSEQWGTEVVSAEKLTVEGIDDRSMA